MNPKPSEPRTLPRRLPQVLRFASHCCPHSSALDPQPAPPTSSPTACAPSSSNTTTTRLSVEECCEAVRLVQAAARMSWPTATAVPYGSLATATALPGSSLNILLQGVLTEQVGGLAAQGKGRGEVKVQCSRQSVQQCNVAARPEHQSAKCCRGVLTGRVVKIQDVRKQ